MAQVVPTDLFANALQVLGVLGAAETAPDPADTELCRRAYNRMVGQWNNRRRNSAFIQTQAFTFSTTKQKYTLGNSTNSPAPDFGLTGQDAPRQLEPYAQLVLTGSTPNINIQLAVINVDQYALNPIPTLTATIPATLWYQPSVQGTTPNATIWMWPEPTTTSNQLQIWWRNQLVQLAAPPAADITTAISLPDGYEEALTLSLAEKLWLAFPKRTDLEELKRQARLARADIQTNNAPPPKISTTDGTHSSKASGFNWLTRTPG
jgi:hypothetical protein